MYFVLTVRTAYSTVDVDVHFTLYSTFQTYVQYSTRSSVTSVDNNYVFSLFLIPTYVRLLLIYKIFSAWATVAIECYSIRIVSKMCFYIFNFAPELSSWNAQSRFIRENYLLFTFVKDKQILNIVLILELLILKWQKTRVGNSLFGFSWETLVFLWTKERNSDLLFSKSYSNRSRCSLALAIRSWA